VVLALLVGVVPEPVAVDEVVADEAAAVLLWAAVLEVEL
jgi:hypothetical protein